MAGTNPRRILSIWLPSLSIDRWRLHAPTELAAEHSDIPVALISDTARGPTIAAVNEAARAAGVRAYARLADMRALAPSLATFPYDAAADHALLEAMALWAQRWGPWSSLDPPDGVLVDITGVAHLYGGEEELVSDVVTKLVARGFAARSGIAATAGAAWAISHYAQSDRTIIAKDGDPLNWLALLPVAALRLDAETQLLLRRMGLKRIGDLVRITRDALARRFRNRSALDSNPLIRLDQLLGRTPEPSLPVLAVETPLVQRRLVEPLLHRSQLDRIVADLAEDMARVLEARLLGARRLILRLFRVDGLMLERRQEFASSTRDAAHMTRLFATKLDDIDAGFGIDMCQLVAPWTEALHLNQTPLYGEQPLGTTLAICLDRMAARLGEVAITRPISYASHMPERSQRWVPPFGPLSSVPQGTFTFHARPLKIFDHPERIEVIYGLPEDPPRRFRWRGQWHDILRLEGPERIAPEWLRAHSTTRLRDYYMVEDTAGRRYWIYRNGLIQDGRGGPPNWYLHGTA